MTTYHDEVDGMNEPISDDSLALGVAPKKKLGFGFWLSAFWVILITLLAILAPILPIKDPSENYLVYETTENLRGV